MHSIYSSKSLFAFEGDLEEDETSSESDNNDWKPKQNRRLAKAGKKQKIKGKITRKKVQEPISKTLVDLMDIGDGSEESSDEDWAPQLESKSQTSLDSTDLDQSEDKGRSSLNGEGSS